MSILPNTVWIWLGWWSGGDDGKGDEGGGENGGQMNGH